MSYKSLPIYQQPEGWVVKYPQFSEIADDQAHTFWIWDEPLVDNDLQDLRTALSPEELHNIITVLKLFTLYEMRVGEDYWSKRVASTFKRPEIQRMATMFSCVEFNSHAPFYNKINEILGIDTETFYSEWKDVDQLRKRIEFLAECAGHEDDLLSIAAYSFVEGAVLYSSFAYIKHFQAQECSKDLLKNICSGVDQSMVDENLHSIGGAALFNQIYAEAESAGILDKHTVDQAVYKMARTVLEHEEGIIDLFQEHDGITKQQMKSFVKHRINLCLVQLNYQPIFEPEDTVVEGWFYKNTTTRKLHDFFATAGSEYNIDWKEEKFNVWGVQ